MRKLMNIFISETRHLVEPKQYMNNHWMVLYNIFFFNVDLKSKMATSAGQRFNIDPLG